MCYNMDKNDIGILDYEGNNLNPFNNKPYSDEYKELGKIWSKYPAYDKRYEVIDSIKNNQVILVESSTGSGKTVLVPKFCLHAIGYDKKIVVTLPKQMITKTTAEYASKTLDVKLGREVGYKYKGSDKKSYSDETKLLFATDGTIVAKLLKDETLMEYDAVIIDEAHERKVQIDFLLYLLKNTCKLRKEFKLIIMSATINVDIFKNYFKEFRFHDLFIGSKTNYPIESIFLKEPIDEQMYVKYGLSIIDKIVNTTKEGDIIFFVTSIQETYDVCKEIQKYKDVFCVEVFAGMDQNKQMLAQDKDLYKSDKKTRKIVIATNVAESSLTISNIKFVIDSGYEIYVYYDPIKKAKVMVKKLITQAQAKQRLGRTGRTEPGTCYHLYTKNDFENLMEKFPKPTIKVSNLYGECLRLLNIDKINNVDELKNVFNNFIEPPDKSYINDAIGTLKKLHLIEDNKITNIGKLIADTQLDPMDCISLLYAYRLNCFNEVFAIVNMIETIKGNISELFIVPTEEQKHLVNKYKKAKQSLRNENGDHLTLLNIFTKYVKLRKMKTDDKLKEWLYKSFLKRDVLEKCYKNYKRIRYNIIDKIKGYNTDKLKIDDKYKIKTKILASLLIGFQLNINYRRTKQIRISKESFLSEQTENSFGLLYNDLLIIGKTDSINMVIVSKLTEQCIKLSEQVGL